jgi:hypothetical protein
MLNVPRTDCRGARHTTCLSIAALLVAVGEDAGSRRTSNSVRGPAAAENRSSASYTPLSTSSLKAVVV